VSTCTSPPLSSELESKIEIWPHHQLFQKGWGKGISVDTTGEEGEKGKNRENVPDKK
jgi:hypothetical protein